MADAGFWRDGLRIQEAGLPIGTAGVGAGTGDRAEDAFRQAMLGSGGDMMTFFSNGLVGSITALALAMLFWAPMRALISKIRTVGAR